MKKIFLFLLACSTGWARAQTAAAPPRGWHLLDAQQNNYLGISLNEAYARLKGRVGQTVIVAVIDSGIDTAHEDLRPVLWTNPREIPGNGIDDDGNGYVDDVHGWNFDGAPDGQNLARNSHEPERVYHQWKKSFEGKSEGDISADQKFIYGQWRRAADIIDKDYREAQKQQDYINQLVTALHATSDAIGNALKTPGFTASALKPLDGSSDPKLLAAARFWQQFFNRAPDTGTTNLQVLEEVDRYKSDIDRKIALKENAPEDFRGELVHDRYTDITDSIYGNNNLKEGSGNHGTLVAGVIGAVRNNGIGIDGIADHVRIMSVRAVPGGDEHDKDVALAIRYAVNNGASIINMSFGKYVSPYKSFVDDAIRYAASRGVLLIHAAGNESTDLSKQIDYPAPLFNNGTAATNFLNVGASSSSGNGYVASFSNYSHTLVDVFAPGVAIYSTATNNLYESADGTSLASPVATGVAALLRSYFPSLSPADVIRIMKASGTPVNVSVLVPGSDKKKIPFSELSSSGRVINAANAVQMALAEERK